MKCDAAKKPQEPFELGLSLATVATLLSATTEDNKRLIVTLRLPPCIDLSPPTIRDAKPLPKKKAEYQKAIKAMKAAGVVIDEKLTIDDIIREFKSPTKL